MLGVVNSNLIARSIFSHIGDLTAPGTLSTGRVCCGFSRVSRHQFQRWMRPSNDSSTKAGIKGLSLSRSPLS